MSLIEQGCGGFGETMKPIVMRESQRIVLSCISISSGLVSLIAGMAIFGQAFQVDRLHHWLGTVGMAFNTALCFLLLALNWVIFIHFWTQDAD